MLKKYCAHPGCNRLIAINQKACEEHAGHYDRTVRNDRANKVFADFYNSTSWRTVREQAKQRDMGLCVLCLREGVATAYEAVHHVVPIRTREGWRLRLTLDKLICVCEKHHKILEKETRGVKKV